MSNFEIELHPQERRIDKIEFLFREWNARLHRGAMAHFQTATKLESQDRWWSKANLLFAITVLFLAGTKGLTHIYDNALDRSGLMYDLLVIVSEASGVLVPFFSLLVVLTAAWQYVSQFPSRAARHNRTATEYANLRRKIERYWTKGSIHEEAIHSLSRSYNTIARFAPLVPEKTWKSVEQDAKKFSDSLTENYFHRN